MSEQPCGFRSREVRPVSGLVPHHSAEELPGVLHAHLLVVVGVFPGPFDEPSNGPPARRSVLAVADDGRHAACGLEDRFVVVVENRGPAVDQC